MGWSMPNDQEIFSLEEMIENFTFERIDPTGPVFDVQKLDWLNGEYIRSLSDEKLVERISEGLFSKYSVTQIEKVVPLVKERLKKLSELDSLVVFFFEEIEVEKMLFLPKNKETKEVKEILSQLTEKLSKIKWEEKALENEISSFQEKTDWTRKELFMMIRIISTGREATPPLFSTLEVLGKEKTLSRITKAIEQL